MRKVEYNIQTQETTISEVQDEDIPIVIEQTIPTELERLTAIEDAILTIMMMGV